MDKNKLINENKLLYQELIDKQMELNEIIINDIGTLTKEIESITIYINKLKVYIDNIKQNKQQGDKNNEK